MESREEILGKYDKIEDYHMGCGVTLEDAEFAMQEYSDQQNKALIDEIELLKGELQKYKDLHYIETTIADLLQEENKSNKNKIIIEVDELENGTIFHGVKSSFDNFKTIAFIQISLQRAIKEISSEV